MNKPSATLHSGSWLLSLLSSVFLATSGMAASTAYVDSTRHLDLTRVELVVVASPDMKGRLYQRAWSLLSQAGLSLSTPQQAGTAATLTLALDPRPIGEACPGHVLYKPSLALTEPVVIPRNSVVINDITWWMGTDAAVLTPVPITRLEEDLDGFINQFITDYTTANPGGPDGRPIHRQGSRPAAAPTAQTADAGLANLQDSPLRVSVLAGPWTESLKLRALHQLTDAGFQVSPAGGSEDAVTIAVELIQRSIEDQCPGKVLFERGLYVIEPVRIRRNPAVSFWSDTWLKESMHIVMPVAAERLTAEQDAVLEPFIRLLRTKRP